MAFGHELAKDAGGRPWLDVSHDAGQKPSRRSSWVRAWLQTGQLWQLRNFQFATGPASVAHGFAHGDLQRPAPGQPILRKAASLTQGDPCHDSLDLCCLDHRLGRLACAWTALRTLGTLSMPLRSLQTSLSEDLNDVGTDEAGHPANTL